MNTSVRVGDTVTIQDYKCDGEYTVLALNTDPSRGGLDGFAWLLGPSGYVTQAVSYLKRKPEYTVEFYITHTDVVNRDLAYAILCDTQEEVIKYLSELMDDEIVVIRKE